MDEPRATTASIVHDDPFAAGRELAEDLCDELSASPDLVLAFVSAELSLEEVVKGLYSKLPSATRVIGCSSFAEINSSEALTHSATALGLRLGGIACQPFVIAPHGMQSFEAGRRVGEELAPLAPDLILAFPDVLQLNATQFLLGLQDVLGQEVPIVGGAPSDNNAFQKTYQACDRTVLCGGAVGVALKGPVRLVTAAQSGYIPIGVTRTCTRVENGNVVLTIDDTPALEIYRELLGPRASEMPAVSIEFPIGVVGGALGTQRQADEGLLLVRAIFRVDEARGALVLGGDLPEGSLIHVTRATRADVVRGADEATRAALEAMPDPDVALLFNCSSRKNVMGPRYKDECAASFARLPPRVPRAGFYTFGELSPVRGVTMHHESTFTLALLKLGA